MATVALLGTATFNTTAGNKTVTATPTVGDLIVIIAAATGVTTTVADNGTGGTYTQVDSTRTGFSTSGNLQVFVRNNLVSSAVSTTYTATQTSSTGGGLVVLRVTGMTKTGSSAVRSSGGQSSGGSGTTPAPVLSQTPLAANPIITAVANASNSTTTVVQRTGYTERFDNGYNTPATGLEVSTLDSGETSATITYGGTSGSAFASVAIELDYAQIALTQAAYRFYEDGTETGSTAIAAQSTNITRDVTSDSNLQLRARLQETGGGAGVSTDDYQLQYAVNSGTYYNVGSVVANYYFDSSDAAPSDPNNVWTNDANAFDTSEATSASCSTTGSTSSNYLLGQGTNAPGSGGTITQVRARIWNGSDDAQTVAAVVYSDGLAETLSSTIFGDGAGSGYGAWYTLTVPTGGWNWSVVQALEAKIYKFAGGGALSVFAMQVEVTSNGSVAGYNSASLTDGNATTNRLTGGSGSFVAGEISEDGLVDDLAITASNYTELLYSLTLVASALANGDTLDFRVLRNSATTGMTYTVTPRITVIKKTSTLTDNFDDNSTNSTLWNTYGGAGTTIAETGGKFQLTTSTTPNYGGYISDFTYDLTGSSMYIQLVSISNTSLASLEAYFKYNQNADVNSLFFNITGGTIYAISRVSSSNTTVASATYNSSTHAWLNIREASGTTYFEVSSNGTSWNPFGSLANPFTYSTGANVEFGAGTYAAEASGATVTWDNLNTAPSGSVLTSTQSAIARIATNPTKTQSAVARIANTKTKTQGAISRISNIRTLTQPAISRVANTRTLTQGATARIQNTGVVKTQSAIARIQTTRSNTQTSIARISQTLTKTQPSVARISNTFTKTQSATARIEKSVTKTQSAVARIQNTVTKTQPAISRISNTFTKTQPSVSRIANVRTLTQSATASIVGSSTVTKTQTAIARIATNRSLTQSSVSRISNTLTKTQSAVSRIATVLTSTQPATARIQRVLTKTQSSIARIQNTKTLTQPAISRIQNTKTLTQSAISRISQVYTKTQPSVSRIQNTVTKTQSATARIANTGLVKTQSAVARIATTRSLTQTAISRISITSTKTQSATARVARNLTKTQSATARIATTVAKTQTAVARIQTIRSSTTTAISRIAVVSTKTQPVTARVANVRTKTQTATANITINGLNNKTQPATARIAVARTLTQSGVSRIANTRTTTQPAISRISQSFTKTQSAISRIAIQQTKTQTATARVLQAQTYTLTQTATASIIVNQTRTFTQSATARISITTPLIYDAVTVEVKQPTDAVVAVRQQATGETSSTTPALTLSVQQEPADTITVPVIDSRVTVQRKGDETIAVTVEEDTLTTVLS